MSAYDRDAALERQQIREISLNVARRLRQVLDRNRYIPAMLRPEVESTVRVITGIQRDIDQIMGALPADEALDFAILTHIMGGQRHALDLLEILEEKLEGGRGLYQRDSTRVHQALIAVSREIEQDAMRYAGESAALPHAPSPPPAGFFSASGRSRPPPPAYGAPTSRLPSRKHPRKPRPTAKSLAQARAAIGALATRPVPVAVAALAIGAGLVVAAQTLMRSDDGSSDRQAVAAQQPEEKGREAGVGTDARTGVEATATSALGNTQDVAASAPAMEQPYLVVLATRRSTEELQQDYRSFKGAYPDLLGNAKARVDRVQGQDRQTWYRLSLIPPQSRDDAKALCGSLRKAGLTGCWIKPVPLH